MNDRSRWIALVVLCTGMLMIVLDMTIVNVALPSIQADLGFTQAGLAWVVNAYLIAFAGLLLLAGRLGDLAGRRDVFLTGLAVFTAASLVCGFAVNQEMLIAARFAQGTGGALTSAVILGMIVTMFPGPREQAQAIGVFAFVASAGAAVGLLAGGVLTQVLNWHWIFFVNLPVGAIAAICAVRVIGRDRGAGLRAGMDVPGALLITAAMMLAVFTIVDPAAQQGWLAPKTLGLAAASLVLLGAFIARQRTARHPLMPLRIFASRNVTGANLVQVLGTAGMFGMFFLGSLYLRQIQGYDPLQIGLAFLPVAVVMGALSVRYTDRLVMRFGARTLLFPGLGLIAAGLALFALAPAARGGYLAHVFPVTLLIGTGAGLCFPALMTLAMSSATPQDAGLASGLVNTTAQIGGALGLAVLATVSASRTNALIAQHRPTAVALTEGYRLAFWIAFGLVVAAAAVAAALLRPQRARRGRAAAGTRARPGCPGRLTASRASQGHARHAVDVATCTKDGVRCHIHTCRTRTGMVPGIRDPFTWAGRLAWRLCFPGAGAVWRADRAAADWAAAGLADAAPGRPAGNRRDLRGRRARHAGARRAGGGVPPPGDGLAVAHVRRQHRGRLPARLFRHPADRTSAAVQLPAATARHRPVRGAVHFLHHAGGDPRDA